MKNSFFLLTLISTISLTACREYRYFLDMHFSPAVDSQEEDRIGKRKGNMLPPENTIPYPKKTKAFQDENYIKNKDIIQLGNSTEDYIKADKLFKSPLENSNDVLSRGENRFKIYCAACHGVQGRGDGTIKEKWAAIPNIVDTPEKPTPVSKYGVGRLYHIITVGILSMSGYASQIPEKDRWAISHYVKYLQKKNK